MCSVTTGNIFFGGWGRGHLSASFMYLMLHLKLQLLWPCLKQHATSTNVMQHSQADLNICINPLLRSPAQAHALEFHCIPLSQCHSQIPKIYTFQTWYFLSLHHSFPALVHHVTPLPMLSPLVSTQCLQHSAKAAQIIRIS